MSVQTCCRGEVTDQGVRARPRAAHGPLLLAGIVFVGVATLLLVLEGPAWWWVAPGLLVAAHLALLAGVSLGVGAAARVWRAHMGQSCCQGDSKAPHGHPEGSVLIRWPRAYDLLVRVLSLGFEGRMRRWLVGLGAPKGGDAVLDVGCGTGTLLRTAAAQVGSAGRLCGVEPAEEMVAYARHKATAAGLRLELAVGSADRLPHPDASFDVVFCTFVMHHLPALIRITVLREMRRVLRPGGRIVVADFCRPHLPVSPAWLLHVTGGGARGSIVETAHLEQAGFENVTCERSFTGAIGAWIGAVPACTPPPPFKP